MSINKTILLIHMQEMDGYKRFMNDFEEIGFKLITIDSLNEAYQILAAQTIDIIAIDLDMSYRETFNFCYRIKNNANLSKIIIIAFSSAHEKYGIYLSTRTKEERKWLNVDFLVHKPVSSKNIYRLLKKEIAILEHVDTADLDNKADFQTEFTTY